MVACSWTEHRRSDASLLQGCVAYDTASNWTFQNYDKRAIVIDSLAIAAGTAFVTIIGTRWVDTRRHLAQERGLLAAELRVQLAEAHRRANVCVQALSTAMDASASFTGDEPAGKFLDAINEFKQALDHLRLQTSELLVRTDPSAQRGLSEPMTRML